MKMSCPHCGANANIRSSRRISRITRELYCQCTNLECGHTFVGLVEVVRTVSPSATPDPEIARQLAARSAPAEQRQAHPTPPANAKAVVHYTRSDAPKPSLTPIPR
ncbi:MAG: ogr/Delta-like zinc finger family protein [Cupriavidus sp.]|nr:ogr/Delta-like zinc finger family protein [Cupriavidus sp.]